jgi:hypothetical protein
MRLASFLSINATACGDEKAPTELFVVYRVCRVTDFAVHSSKCAELVLVAI